MGLIGRAEPHPGVDRMVAPVGGGGGSQAPQPDRGARQRAGLRPAAASNTLSCHRTTLSAEADQIPLTGITVSTAINGSKFRGADAVLLGRKAKSSPRKWLADEGPRAVEDPMHVETSFVRKLGDLTRVRRGTPDRLMKATAER